MKILQELEIILKSDEIKWNIKFVNMLPVGIFDSFSCFFFMPALWRPFCD